jgi:hypothetical protein
MGVLAGGCAAAALAPRAKDAQTEKKQRRSMNFGMDKTMPHPDRLVEPLPACT